MSNQKKNAKVVKKSVVMDVNNDSQDLDTNLNTGGSPVVVMIGGKPQIAGSNHVESVEENEAEADKMLAANRNVRVTALPDGFNPEEEEVVLTNKVSTEGPLEKKTVKPISRITNATESSEPAPAKRKRGRPKGSKNKE